MLLVGLMKRKLHWRVSLDNWTVVWSVYDEKVFGPIQHYKQFVDYETQFNKAFLDPVKAILNAIGWSDEKKITLESFFG